MAFDLKAWRNEFKSRIRNWRHRMQSAGVNSIYAFISASALWPLVEAFRQDNVTALAAVGGVLAGVGGNLLANLIQTWKDEAKDETHAAHQLETKLIENPDLHKEIDTVLEKLSAFPLAEAELHKNDRAWFKKTLRKDLHRLGNLKRFSVVIKGDVKGSVIIVGNRNKVIRKG